MCLLRLVLSAECRGNNLHSPAVSTYTRGIRLGRSFSPTHENLCSPFTTAVSGRVNGMMNILNNIHLPLECSPLILAAHRKAFVVVKVDCWVYANNVKVNWIWKMQGNPFNAKFLVVAVNPICKA